MARREELIQKRCIDDANDGSSFEEKGDRDAEHGKDVCEVDGTVEWIDTPRRRIVDEIFSGSTSRVGLFSDEPVGALVRIFPGLMPKQLGLLVVRILLLN